MCTHRLLGLPCTLRSSLPAVVRPRAHNLLVPSVLHSIAVHAALAPQACPSHEAALSHTQPSQLLPSGLHPYSLHRLCAAVSGCGAAATGCAPPQPADACGEQRVSPQGETPNPKPHTPNPKP